MKLSTERLNALLKLSTAQSFSKAASELGVTQSALTQRIQKLEDELETSLVIREPGNVRLTEEGNRLAQLASNWTMMEEEVLSGLESASNKISGTVRVGAYSSVARSVLIPSLKPIAERCRDVKYEVFSREVSELPGMLRRGEIDFAIINHSPANLAFKSIKLGEEKNIWVTPKSKHYPIHFLDHDPNDTTTGRFFEIQNKRPPTIERSYFDDIGNIIEAVRNGLGQAVVSEHLVTNDRKIQTKPGQKKLIQPIYLCHRRSPYYSCLHDVVIETLQSEIPNYL